MALDIVEIALEKMTDGAGFEKIAGEVMRSEGYQDIKPLGGSGDLGRDAFEDRFYYRKGRVHIVFQFTLEDYIAGKLRDTVKKLVQNQIQFSELVIVTRVKLSSERQDALKRIAREEFDVTLQIYEHKTLVNRLSDFTNGIFYRHFPDIERQIEVIKAGQPVFQDKSGQLETAMLKASIAFVFGRGTDPIRKSLFDHLILATLFDSPSEMTLDNISDKVASSLECKAFPKEQISTALKRLESLEFITSNAGLYKVTKTAINSIEGATIQANTASASVISDIVEGICKISTRLVSRQERDRLERNARNVLAEIFRLMGMELANQFLQKEMPSPLYFESSDRLVTFANQQIDKTLGELLISALADMIQNPSAEQSQMLASWARAYLGAAVMNLDPSLQEFQQTRLRKKIFILDTDFVLRCIIDEVPGSRARLALVQRLADMGCHLVIPEAVITECSLHAQHSSNTEKYFRGKLTEMTSAFVEKQVYNLFVQGFFYGKIGRLFPLKWTFEDYLRNYYDPAAPTIFARDVITARFPSAVKIIDPKTMLSADLPRDIVEQVSGELLKVWEMGLKYSWRTKDEVQKLAHTDAELFVTALQINTAEVAQGATNCILGGVCYIITDSGQYLRATKALGIRDVITTRPQKLLALMEVATGPLVDDMAFARLFENPLLIHTVTQLWPDVKSLLANGIGLAGKTLVRLRWDLDKILHDRISALQTAEDRAEAEGEKAAVDSGDIEFFDLLKEAISLGYSIHPGLKSLKQALEQTKNQAEMERTAREQLEKRLDLLSGEIERFGKRKQRYLKKIAGRQ